MPSAICSACGRKLVDSMKYEFHGKTYCYDCFQRLYAEQQEIDAQKADLYQYIYNLYDVTELPNEAVASLDRQIKSGKKIKGIKATLQYYFEIEGRPLGQISFIGRVVEENYEAARHYVAEINKVKEHNKTVNVNVPPVTITLSPKKITKVPHGKRKVTKIEDL